MEMGFNQESHIARVLRTRRKRQLISFGAVVAFLVLMLIGRGNDVFSLGSLSSDAFSFMLLAGVLVFIVFSVLNWRCPACGNYLGRGLSPKFCHKCGVKFRSE